MYHKILIATDGSELSDKAVEYGVSIAKEAKVPVSIVTVTESWSALQIAHDMQDGNTDPLGDYERGVASSARMVLDRAGANAKAHNIVCDLIHVRNQNPAEGIIATAERTGSDLIVMSSHGRRGVGRILLGSQANEVVTLSKIPVLIVR
jgi:nucleotide-binding universal stress UspA family protein